MLTDTGSLELRSLGALLPHKPPSSQAIKSMPIPVTVISAKTGRILSQNISSMALLGLSVGGVGSRDEIVEILDLNPP